jgi:hypothetical protein
MHQTVFHENGNTRLIVTPTAHSIQKMAGSGPHVVKSVLATKAYTVIPTTTAAVSKAASKTMIGLYLMQIEAIMQEQAIVNMVSIM